MDEQERARVAGGIATALGEHQPGPRRQVALLTHTLGVDAVRALVDEARAVQAAGGMRRADGQPRTLGGVFFALALERAPEAVRETVWPRRQPAAARAPQVPPFQWSDRLPLVEQALIQLAKGVRMGRIELKLTGRPGEPVFFRADRVDMVMVAVEVAYPELPRGLPTPPALPRVYTVYMQAKHWRRVAPLLAADPTDELLVIGVPFEDQEAGRPGMLGITIDTRIARQARGRANANTVPATR